MRFSLKKKLKNLKAIRFLPVIPKYTWGEFSSVWDSNNFYRITERRSEYPKSGVIVLLSLFLEIFSGVAFTDINGIVK